jgi:vitamin B12 transporter
LLSFLVISDLSAGSSWPGVGSVRLKADTLPVQDTVALLLVEVYEPDFEAYSAGQTWITVGERDLYAYQGQPLSALLQQRTGLFLREYGSGMIASLTMRGTSAGHNAVFWNGLPINSPSLGQTDFSTLPIGSFDQATILMGSSGALFGSDAIGGSVHLNRSLSFDKGHQVSANTAIGSFGRWNQQLSYSFSDKRFSSRSRVYRNFHRNNFPFVNLSKIGTPVERQEHAEVLQLGMLHDLAWNINSKSQISTSLWYNKTDRQVQPVMGSNTRDVQVDQSFRWVVDYAFFGKALNLNIKSGMVQDRLLFNTASDNRTYQYFLATDLDYKLGKYFQNRSGIRLTWVEGRLSTYDAEEARWELYHATAFQPNSAINISVNLRQQLYKGENVPFTPSIGASWDMFKSNRQTLSWTAAASRSYKIPTLNDRFWNPGGNPDLLPETSLSLESGLKAKSTVGNWVLEQQVTAYRMWVDNWIIWLPRGSFWSPDNIREVQNTGLEYRMNVSRTFGQVSLKWDGNYALTQAINQTGISNFDRSIGKQLPYTPLHKAQSMLTVVRGNYEAFANATITGRQFTETDNSTEMPAFQLMDIGSAYQWKLKGIGQGRLGLQINNLFNSQYQVLRLRAMPGRNYQFNFQIYL